MIRTQIESLLEIMMVRVGESDSWLMLSVCTDAMAGLHHIHRLLTALSLPQASVQDRVCTDRKVLQKEPLQLNKDIQEVPVWGLDSYTRRMIEIALEDRVGPARRTEASLRRFIEKKLLPAINAQSPDHAHNINYAIDAILEVLHSDRSSSLLRMSSCSSTHQHSPPLLRSDSPSMN